MEEKPETPSSDSAPEIHSILKSMLHENKTPLPEKTALANLKNVLSKADEAALNNPHKTIKASESASPPPPSLKIPEAPKVAPVMPHVFESDPVKELDALIKRYRSQSRSL